MTSQCTRIMFQRQTRQMLHRVRICVGGSSWWIAYSAVR